jgi:hypothetical protein
MLLIKIILVLKVSCKLINWTVQQLLHWVVSVHHQVLQLSTHRITMRVRILSSKLPNFVLWLFMSHRFNRLFDILFAILSINIFFILVLDSSVGFFCGIGFNNFRLILLWFFKFINIVRIDIGLDVLYILNVGCSEMFIEIGHF